MEVFKRVAEDLALAGLRCSSGWTEVFKRVAVFKRVEVFKQVEVLTRVESLITVLI